MNDLLWFMGGVVVSVMAVIVWAFTWQIGGDDCDEEEEWRHWK